MRIFNFEKVLNSCDKYNEQDEKLFISFTRGYPYEKRSWICFLANREANICNMFEMIELKQDKSKGKHGTIKGEIFAINGEKVGVVEFDLDENIINEEKFLEKISNNKLRYIIENSSDYSIKKDENGKIKFKRWKEVGVY